MQDTCLPGVVARTVSLTGEDETVRVFPVVVRIKGDWQFLAKSAHLTRYYNTKNICHLCMASKQAGPLYFADAREDAGWRQTAEDPPLPMQENPPATLAQIPTSHQRILALDLVRA